jgi:hypothetical protein
MVKMAVLISWVVTLCGLVGRYQLWRNIFRVLMPCELGRNQFFGEMYCLHLGGLRMEVVCFFPECWYLSASPHGVTSFQNVQAPSLALEMETVCFPETLVSTCKSASPHSITTKEINVNNCDCL